MTDIVERLRAMENDLVGPYRGLTLEAANVIERLRAALQAMLECHGKPHREEWINDAAYQHAVEVDAQARRALEPMP